ncbi:MAG: hypothetical protein FWH53_00840 [Leptospirales bacterium]|nr:hypothetical protein [Leptospirales bacterium]
MKKNPTILKSEQDGKIIYIKFVDGKEYKLQHPGNRTHLEWQQETFDFEKGLDTISFLDKAFEHCVIPEGHGFKPTIDNVKPHELEVWQKFLRMFLRGEIAVVAESKQEELEQTPASSKRGS